VFRRPELLVAASVPVLLLAGVLSWHRDVVCTRSGCGTVAASAWTGSPVWAVVLVIALALGGVWVLLPPTRGEVPLGVAALTGVAGVVSAGIVLVSLDALVFNHAAFFGFDLPVTETFPVLAVHPGPGLLLGLLGLFLQAAGGWASVRHRTALLAPPRRRPTVAQPWPPAVPSPESWPVDRPLPAIPRPPTAAADPWPVRTPSPTTPRPAATADRWPAATPPVAGPGPAAMAPAADRWPAATFPVADPGPAASSAVGPQRAGASPGTPHALSQPPAAAPLGRAWDGPVPPSAQAPQPEVREAVRDRSRQPGVGREPGWEPVAFGQGAPPPRRHRRRAE
jgi:hypothetical protein